MENEIKKHIDRLRKNSTKTTLDNLSSECTLEEKNKYINQLELEFKYDQWLFKTLSYRKKDPYFPISSNELDLYELLTLEVSYKQTFKLVCDIQHPLIEALLSDLGFSEAQVKECIENTRNFNSEILDYYLLFKDELTDNDKGLEIVQSKIGQLAKDSSQGTIISHSAKMTNPACKYPKVFSTGIYQSDGFIRTGNSTVDFDMHINATKLKVFKFLSLKYHGQTLLTHIEKNNITTFTELFLVSDEQAKNWINSFLPCIRKPDLRTDRLVKQAYFPVKNDYHLLSFLQPSGLVFLLKEKIDELNDRSPQAYVGKKLKKEGKFYNTGFSSISNLTVTKHGGDHPKNISGLNNKYQSYYLINSLPPSIQKRSIHFPKSNFFTESLRHSDCRDVFHALHKILKTDYNNINIREGRDYRLQELLDRIIDKMWAVRSVAAEQYLQELSQLKHYQKVWLCDGFKQEREESDDWLNQLTKDISLWIIRSYEKIIGKQAIKLGKEELIKVTDIINQNKEALR